MDITTSSASAVGASQLASQQTTGLLAIKNAAAAQNLLAGMLEKSAKELPLMTSGSVGTNINTSA